jgi:hypothetical protein
MTTSAKSPLVPVLERRIRALTWLAGATALLVVFAILSQWQRSSSGKAEFDPVRMFPALEAEAERIAAIEVQTKASTFTVVRDATGKWTVPEKGNYRADFNEIRRAVLGLATLELVEQRTARADWQDKLGLGLPKTGGTGTLVTLRDEKGATLASLVAGMAVEGASAGDRAAIYVRRPDEAQTFVARGNFEPVTEIARWLDKSFIDFPRDRIRTVSMKPFQGPSYTLNRATPETANFAVVERLPSGRSLRSAEEPNGVGNSLIGMSFTDVVSQSEIDFSNAARASFQTFDGMALNVMIVERDKDFWIAFDAVEIPAAAPAAPGKDAALKPNIPAEVAELNAMGKGRAFKVARFKGTLLTTPLEALLNLR